MTPLVRSAPTPEARDPLPPGHPTAWHAITAGTLFADTVYPWELRALDLRRRPGVHTGRDRNKS